MDITSLKEPPVRPKKVLFWLKKAIKSKLFALAIALCPSKKISPLGEKVFGRGTTATPQKTNFPQDIGPVRRGNMKVEEVLKLLEKHEEECNRRYADIQRQLDKLDVRLWGIAALIVATALAQRFM